MSDFQSIPHRLVDGICSGTVYPFVGAGFSKNAANGKNYPSTNELAEKLAARLPESKSSHSQQKATLSFLDVTAEYKSATSLADLHYEICSILPEIDGPGVCHYLLMSFPWRMIYTTNYDLLLEKADEARSISVATDEELDAIRASSKRPVFKLCGDCKHLGRMRATRERLELASLESECPHISEDLLWHLGEASFLFIGYSMKDSFLQFGRKLVSRQAAKKGSPVPTSFFLGWNLTTQERTRLKESGLTVIDLKKYGFGPNRANALAQFFNYTLNYCRQWGGRHSPYLQPAQPLISRMFRPRSQAPSQPEPTQQEKNIYPWTDAEDLPIIVAATEGKRSQEILEQFVRPVLEEAKYKELLISVGTKVTTTLGDEWQSVVNRILSKSFCGIFVFDQPSELLEGLVERAISRRCRAIILCNDEADLGFITTELRHRGFSFGALSEYIAEELFTANVEQRLSRSAELCEEGDFAMSVLQAWLVCELAHAHARKKLGKSMPLGGLSSLQKPVELVRFLREQGYVVQKEVEASIESTRLLRNKVAHDGYLPSKEEAAAALVMTRKLVRLLHREDLPEFLRELTTGSTTLNDKDPERRRNSSSH